MENLIYSSVGTLVAEFATLPICTIKTHYQNTHSNSIFDTVKSVYNMYGIKAFYAASFPAMFGQVVSTSSKYTIYRQLCDGDDPASKKIMSGVGAGLISSLITHPLDIIKVQWQLQKSVMNEIRQHGKMVFYRGYTKTISKILISSSLFFPIYDTVNTYVNNPVYASLLSSTISTIIMQPIDYLKTRHLAGMSLYSSDLRTYYKGLSLNLLRVVPHFTIVMSVIDLLQRENVYGVIGGRMRE